MKALIFAVLAFFSCSSYAWWSPIEAIRVSCKADPQTFPEYGEIRVIGRSIQIEKNSQSTTYPANVYQGSHSKSWETSSVDLYVALKRSWGGFHSGTLVEKGSEIKDIPLWCFPQEAQ